MRGILRIWFKLQLLLSHTGFNLSQELAKICYIILTSFLLVFPLTAACIDEFSFHPSNFSVANYRGIIKKKFLKPEQDVKHQLEHTVWYYFSLQPQQLTNFKKQNMYATVDVCSINISLVTLSWNNLYSDMCRYP